MKSILTLILIIVWLLTTLILTISIIGIAITMQEEWTDIGKSLIQKL